MIIPALLSILASLQANQIPKAILPAAPGPNAVMATVNGVPIKVSDVEKLIWDWAGYEVTNDLVLFQLILNRAAQDKVSVTPAEVQKSYDAQMAEIKKQVPPGQDLDTLLHEKGFPKSRFYIHVEADLLVTKIVDKVVEQKFKPSDYVSVSTLIIPLKSGSVDDLHDATGKAQDIYNRLAKKGEDWDKVLGSTDQTKQIVDSHGALGWRAIEAFPPLTKVELRTLKVHEYTKPAQTPNGLQIFRVDALGANAEPSSLAVLKKAFTDDEKKKLLPEIQKAAKIVYVLGKPPK